MSRESSQRNWRQPCSPTISPIHPENWQRRNRFGPCSTSCLPSTTQLAYACLQVNCVILLVHMNSLLVLIHDDNRCIVHLTGSKLGHMWLHTEEPYGKQSIELLCICNSYVCLCRSAVRHCCLQNHPLLDGVAVQVPWLISSSSLHPTSFLPHDYTCVPL